MDGMRGLMAYVPGQKLRSVKESDPLLQKWLAGAAPRVKGYEFTLAYRQ